MRLQVSVAALLVFAIGCGGSSNNGGSSGGSKSLVVAATPAAVLADGKNTILVHVEGVARGPVSIVTNRGWFESSDSTVATFAATPFDVVLHTCDSSTKALCAGTVVLQAVDADLVSGSASVVFGDASASSGSGSGTGTGSGTGGTDGGSGGSDAGTTTPASYAVSLVASASRIPADGKAAVVITAAVTADGQPVSGRAVTFAQTGTAATLTAPTATDASGTASVKLTSDPNGGTAVVTGTDTASGQKATISIEMPQLGQVKVLSQQFQVQGVRSSGFQEVNLVTFELRDTGGKTYPAALDVSFSHESLYDSFIGAVPTCTTAFPSVCTAKGRTDDKGQVTVALTSGMAAGPVSLSASATAGKLSASAVAGNIAVVGAKASGAHITVDCTPKNVPALSDNDCSYSHYAGPGSNVTCTATLADRFNNVLGVPTLTTFLSEAGNASAPALTSAGVATGAVVVTGGRLPDRDLLGVTKFDNEPTATIGNGCGVRGSPRAGLVTVIAMSAGEEGFVDLDGDGKYSVGEPFIDLGEPYVDLNDNGRRDEGEPYVDVNHNGKYDGPNGVWDGDTVIWAETRILYTDQPAIALDGSLSKASPSTVAVSGQSGAASQLVNAVFVDENVNPVSPSLLKYGAATQGSAVTAAVSWTPPALDRLGVGFSQLYCDKKPGDAGVASCSSACVSSPCYVVTNVGDCDLTKLSDPTKRVACGGFSNVAAATLEVSGKCSTTTADTVFATGTLNGVTTRIPVPATCSVPPTYAVALSAAPLRIVPGGTSVTLSASVTIDGQPAAAGRTVQLDTPTGTIDTQPTNSSGIALFTFTSTASGSVSFVATDVASRKSASLSVSMPDYTVVASAPAMVADATGQSTTVTATVMANGQPVPGRAVMFTAPGAQVTVLSGTTNASGVATATVATIGPAPKVSVTATDVASSHSGSIEVAPPAYAVAVSATALVADATGESATVTATVTANGRPAAGRAVTFAAPGAQVTVVSGTTNASGVATATLRSVASGGTVAVTATDVSSGQSGSATAPLPTFAVAVSTPGMVANPTGQSAAVTAIVTADGLPVQGRVVAFVAPGAQITVVSGTTDASGVATATVATTGPAAKLSVTARDVTSSRTGSVDVAAPVYAVAVSTTAMAPGAAGESATVTAVVTADGRPVAGRAVTFAAPGAQITVVSGTTNASGVATATVTSVASGGTLAVSATDSTSGQTGTANAALPVYAVAVSSPKMIANAAGQFATVSATVTADGQPVAGRAVTFTAPGAQVTIVSGTTDGTGVASATIASTDSGGTITVTAKDNTSGQTGTSTLKAPVYAVAVTAAMAATVPGQTATFTVVVTADGQPVANRVIDLAASRGTVSAPTGTSSNLGIVIATVATTTAGDIILTATDHVSGKSGQATIASPTYAVALAADAVVATATGQTTTVRATLTANGQPVAGRTVQFTSTSAGGSLTPAADVTTVGGIAATTFSSSDVGGPITFTATDPVSGAIATLSVAMPVYMLKLASTAVLATSGGQQATVTAVLTADGQPVQGRRISLSLSGPGGLAPGSGTTNASGSVTSMFTSISSGAVTVIAAEPVSAQTAHVDLVMPVYKLDLQSSPFVADATTANASVTATLTADGQPVQGRTIAFASADLTPIPDGVTSVAGVAKATFSKAASGGSVTVTVAEGVSGQQSQVTLALPVYAVSVTAGASTIDASGNVTTSIQATLTADGEPLGPRALTITPAGKVSPNSGSTSASGVMNATLTQAPTDGATTVTVSDPHSGQTGTVTVAAAPRLGNIAVASQQYTAQGVKGSGYQETSAITFQVSDSAGNPYVAGLRVDFSHASLAGSSIAPAFATTDASGKVTVALSSGTAVGNATVAATASAGGAQMSGVAKAHFIGALPNAAHISLDCTPKNVPAFLQHDCLYSYYGGPGNQVTCTATLADVYGNTIGIPLDASFLSEAGKISAQAVTDAAGVATAKLDVYGGKLPKDVGSGAAGDSLYAGEPSVVSDDVCGGARVHNPRDGVVTVIAMVRGQQGFVDTNGNGVHDAGEPWVDQGEPFVDYNDNGVRDADEPYVDLDGNGQYDPPGTDVNYKNDTVIWAETRIVYTGAPDPNQVRFAPTTPFALFADPANGQTADLRPVLIGDANLNQVSSLDLAKNGVSWSIDAVTASDPAAKVTIDPSADMTAKGSNQLPLAATQLYCSIADGTKCSSQCTAALSPCFPKTSLGFYAPEALPRIGVSCNAVAAGVSVTVKATASNVPVSATLTGDCQ